MTAIRVVDDHVELANVGQTTHVQLDTHVSSSQFLILSSSANVPPQARRLAANPGILLTDSGAGGNYTLSIDDGVVATVSGTRFTGDVSLGDNDLLEVNSAEFNAVDPATFLAHQEGRVYYDIDDRTLSLQTDVSGTTLQIGQEMFVRVRNNTGAPITNGQVVYINGAQGNRPTVALADNLSDLKSHVLGLATNLLPDNSDGYITTYGLVRDLDTLAWPTNTRVYLSSTPGSLTDTKPTGENYVFEIGIVIRQHQTQGVLLATIHDPPHLEDLHDVKFGTPNSGSYLRGDGTYWTTSSFSADVLSVVTSSLNGKADVNAQYLVLAATASLPNERVFTPSTGLLASDAGAGGNYTLSVNNSVVATLTGSIFTGQVLFNDGVSGSIQRTAAGLPYLVPSGGIQITTQSSGQISLYVPVGTAAGTTLAPRGFVDRTHSSMSFASATRTFTIAPAPGFSSYTVVQDGIQYIKTGSESLVVTFSTPGNYFVNFDQGTLFSTLGGPPSFAYPAIAAVYIQSATSSIAFAEERHGTVMDWVTHEYLHRTVATRYASGLTATRIATGAGAADDDAQISLTDGTIYDEDLRHDIIRSATPTGSYQQELGLSTTTAGRFPVYYRFGAGGTWETFPTTNFPCRTFDGTTATRLAYNSITSGTGSIVEIAANGRRCIQWIVATNSFFEPIISVMGQADYSSITDAENAQFSTLQFGSLPFQEFKLLYKIIFRTSTAYANNVNAYIEEIQDFRQASLLPGTFSSVDHASLTGLTTPGSHPASAISTDVTTFNGILNSADTSVQLALNDLDDHQHGIFTGSIIFQSGLTGSLTHLPSGQTYLAAGANVSIVTGSTGQITITASTSSLIRQDGTTIYLGVPSLTSSVYAESYFGQRISLTPSLLATGTIAASGGILAVTSSLTTGKRYSFTADVWAESTGSSDVIYAKGLLVKAHRPSTTAIIAVNKTLDDDYPSAGCTFTCTSSAGDVIFTFVNSSSAGLDTHVAVGWYEVNKP